MTIEQVIKAAKGIKPNSFSNDTVTMWINEVEGMVQTDIMLLSATDVISYNYAEHKNTELLAKAPHDKIYVYFVIAMIDFANNEYDKYANTLQLFNKYFSDYMRWYSLRINPANGKAVIEGYYLSAYALALKHGYVGSEQEWLASLKGEKGEQGKGWIVSGFVSNVNDLPGLGADWNGVIITDGTVFGVGEKEPYKFYVMSRKDNAFHTWVYQGTFSPVVAESWAKGGTGIREGEDNDNSKYYSSVSKKEAENSKKWAVVAEELAYDAQEYSYDAEGYSYTAEKHAKQAQTASEYALISQENAEEYAKQAQSDAYYSNLSEESARQSAEEAESYLAEVDELVTYVEDEIIPSVEKTKTEVNEKASEIFGLQIAGALKGKQKEINAVGLDTDNIKHNVKVQLSSDTITDFSSVKLGVFNKNISNFQGNWEKTNDNRYIYEFKNLPSCKLTFSVISDGTGTVYLQRPNDNGEYTSFGSLVSAGVVRTVTIDKKANEKYRVWANAFAFPGLSEIQVEIGSRATDVVASENYGEIAVSSSGGATVESKPNGTTLISSTEGITITAEYNRDLNSVISALEKAIIST